MYVCVVSMYMSMHVKARVGHQMYSSLVLRLISGTESLHLKAYLRLINSAWFEDQRSPRTYLSAFLLTPDLRLQIPVTAPAFTEVLGIQNQVLMFVWQVLNLLSHLLSSVPIPETQHFETEVGSPAGRPGFLDKLIVLLLGGTHHSGLSRESCKHAVL